jgi:hypothetical protein
VLPNTLGSTVAFQHIILIKKIVPLSFTSIHSSSSSSSSFFFLSFSFFPRITATFAQSPPPPFSHEPNKVTNTNSQILFKFLTKQQKQISPSFLHALVRDKEGLLLRPIWRRRLERRSETEERSEIQNGRLLSLLACEMEAFRFDL